MLKIGKLSFKFEINGKVYRNLRPQNNKSLLANDVMPKFPKFGLNLKSSYQDYTKSMQDSKIGMYVKDLKGKLALDKYSEFAPWNAMLRKNKPIVLFKNNSPKYSLSENLLNMQKALENKIAKSEIDYEF